jgi:hypothetical protein
MSMTFPTTLVILIFSSGRAMFTHILSTSFISSILQKLSGITRGKIYIYIYVKAFFQNLSDPKSKMLSLKILGSLAIQF